MDDESTMAMMEGLEELVMESEFVLVMAVVICFEWIHLHIIPHH
jgi:hypothetical protein